MDWVYNARRHNYYSDHPLGYKVWLYESEYRDDIFRESFEKKCAQTLDDEIDELIRNYKEAQKYDIPF